LHNVSIPKRVSEALNHEAGGISLRQLAVSIPKRVSEALNRLSLSSLIMNPNVSIPKRVSEALNLVAVKPSDILGLFQSLKGFQRL